MRSYDPGQSVRDLPAHMSKRSSPPAYCWSRRGILIRPMSSCCGWWEQASIMSTLSPGLRFPMAAAPAARSGRSPLRRAIRIEKVVKGTDCGVSSATRRTTCESQTTRAGGSFRQVKAAPSSPSVTTRHNLRPSRASRMVCTCGKMSRPFGAPESMGTTRMTTPFSGSRSATSCAS